MTDARDALRQLRTASVVEDEQGVRYYTLVDTPYEDVERFLESLTRSAAMPTPKPITAARALLKTLYNQRRGPTKSEYDTIDAALQAADARTRLDPSKRKHGPNSTRRKR